MKRMKTLGAIAGAAFVVMALAACNDNTPDTITTQSLPDIYAIARNNATGEYKLLDATTYKIDYNYTQQTATIQISSINLPDYSTYPTTTVGPLPFRQTDGGWKVVEATGVKGNTGTYIKSPVFDAFTCSLVDIMLPDGLYAPGFDLRYTLQGYTVFSGQSVVYMIGSVETETEGKVYESRERTVGVAIDAKTMTATVGVTSVCFSEEMHNRLPDGIMVTLKSLPMRFDGGVFTFDVASHTPLSGDTPYADYMLKDLKGTYDPLKGLVLDFDVPSTSSHVTIKADF